MWFKRRVQVSVNVDLKRLAYALWVLDREVNDQRGSIKQFSNFYELPRPMQVHWRQTAKEYAMRTYLLDLEVCLANSAEDPDPTDTADPYRSQQINTRA